MLGRSDQKTAEAEEIPVYVERQRWTDSTSAVKVKKCKDKEAMRIRKRERVLKLHIEKKNKRSKQMMQENMKTTFINGHQKTVSEKCS